MTELKVPPFLVHSGRGFSSLLLTLIDEFTRECLGIRVARRLGSLGTGTLYIEPGSLWENGYCESFNGKLRD